MDRRRMLGWLALVAGALIAALGLESFLIPNQFIDGGVTGVSMLLAKLTGVSLPLLLAAANAPFIWLGYRHMGKGFAARSAVAIAGLALAMSVLKFPVVTQDKLLGAVFGGFFLGAGVGLAIRGGGVLDGTEILALRLSKATFATVGEIIMALNAAIFGAAAMLMGVEPALYSMLTYFAASKTIDYLLHGLEAYRAATIFSAEHAAIRAAILRELGRGVTVMKAVGGYTATEREILYCIVTRLELARLEALVQRLDTTAFMAVSPVVDVIGGTVKHRNYH